MPRAHSAGKAQHLLLAGAQVLVVQEHIQDRLVWSRTGGTPLLQCRQQVAHLEGTKQGRVVLHAEWVEVLAHSASEQRGVLRDGGEGAIEGSPAASSMCQRRQ